MRLMTALMIFGLCLSCAAGPSRPALPGPIRQSIRYQNKAVALYTKGCYPQALQYFNEAHERFSAADDQQGVARSLESIANTQYQMHKLDNALLIYNEAYEIYSAIGDMQGSIRSMTNKAAVLVQTDRLTDAESILAQADARSGPNGTLKALRLKTRAMLLLKQDQVQQAGRILCHSGHRFVQALK